MDIQQHTGRRTAVCISFPFPLLSLQPLLFGCGMARPLRNLFMLLYISFFMAGELICFSSLDTKFERPGLYQKPHEIRLDSWHFNLYPLRRHSAIVLLPAASRWFDAEDSQLLLQANCCLKVCFDVLGSPIFADFACF